MALEGEPFDRPLTHDLLVDILTEFGGAIDRVRVDDLRDGTFYAKVDAERYENGEPGGSSSTRAPPTRSRSPFGSTVRSSSPTR